MKLINLLKREKKTPHCSAVIVAAGSSERMGFDKLLMNLGRKPVIIRTIQAFQNCSLVDEIVVVTRGDKVLDIADLIKAYDVSKVSQVIAGGKTRMESALAGVSAVKSGTELIAIHDGARPLVTNDVIESCVAAAAKYMSVVPAISSTDTLKQVDDKEMIVASVDRSSVVRVQTPQVFNADIIKGALTKAVSDGLSLTDDCSAMEMMGVKTYVVEGDTNNIKLTTPDDFVFAEAILSSRGE